MFSLCSGILAKAITIASTTLQQKSIYFSCLVSAMSAFAPIEISYSNTVNVCNKSALWLIVGQMPIKAGWRDVSFVLWDFSQSNKPCIHLSTTKSIYFSCFVFPISAFAPIEISYSNTVNVCNKSAAEAWICLVSCFGREWWNERLHCHIYLP